MTVNGGYHHGRIRTVDDFIVCPDCGSSDATMEVDEPLDSDDGFRSDYKMRCPECGYETPWVNGGDEPDHGGE